MRTGNKNLQTLILEGLHQINEGDKYLGIEDINTSRVKNFFCHVLLVDDFYRFMREWNNASESYHKKNLPNLEFKPLKFSIGKSYIKVVRDGSVACFIDKYGNVYKAASWQAPAPGVRFYLDNADDIKFDTYGSFLYGNSNLKPRTEEDYI